MKSVAKKFQQLLRLGQLTPRRLVARPIGSTSVDNNQVAASLSPDWDRAVSDAEKVVGYSTSYFSLRCLLSDEISNVALHLRKLVGTNHPLLETAKRLTYTGHSNMKTRGLLVLLLSKAAGHPPNSIDFIDAQRSAGISQRQRSLAEMTEMIYSAHLIHKGIVNLQPSLLVNSKKAQDLHFGNKMSVLSGDFLLASVWKGLGELRDTKVVELMSIAVGDFMEGQFVIETETDLPQKGKTSKTYWEERNFLRAGSLQANSCQSALALAGHSEELQLKAYEFGKNVALAWQAFTELQPFMESYMHPVNTVAAFELISAPIILHVENDGESLESTVIQGGEDGETQIDYQRLHSIVRNGSGIEKTKELITTYTNNALDALQVFPPSDASKALANIVYAIKEQ